MTLETVEAVEVALGRFSLERGPVRRVLLGVSGGPDSLALLLALAPGRSPVSASVATVDHGLRPEAAGEAEIVAAICRDLGLAHRTLGWVGPKPASGNLMGAAREARYRLLAAEAARVGAGAVLVAHHADDQLETHLLALARGARGAALAGMRPWRDLEPGIALVRPFLGLRKRALEDAVTQSGLVALRDPTNADARYRRVQARSALAEGRQNAVVAQRAIDAAAGLRAAEDRALADAIRRAVAEGRLQVDQAGRVAFEPADDAALWPRLLTAAGGGLWPPERAAIERLGARLAEGAEAATLAGCSIRRQGEGLVLVREYGRDGPPGTPIDAAGRTLFDRRFTISGPLPAGAARIEPLGRLGLGGLAQRCLPVGTDGARGILAVHPALCDRFPGLPALTAEPWLAWRIWADLPGEPPDRLTAQPQIAANGLKAVGKDLAATYLRGRVKVRTP